MKEIPTRTYKSLTIHELKGQFNVIKSEAGIFMYCETYMHKWKLYPPYPKSIDIKQFETEAELLDWVDELNRKEKVC